jgi:hypothetical protein
MEQKYHVFISSTLDDLKAERQAAARVVFELGHIPFSMDMFDMNDRDERRLIKKYISSSDYFLSIVAHKYGLLEDAVSRIEIEYNQALKAGVPVIALLIGETARWKAARKEEDEALVQALEELKGKLQSHPHRFWTNVQDLRQKTQDLLIQETNLRPRRGWSPADALVSPVLANELARLIGENKGLKRRVLEGTDTVVQWHENMKHTLEILSISRVSLSFFYLPGEGWENTIKCRYLRLFKLLVPELYLGKTTAELSRFLGSILNPDLERTVRKDYPTPSNTIKKIMTDFHLLKLVSYSGGGEDEVWRLTEYGKGLYSVFRMRQFERGLKAVEARRVGPEAASSGGLKDSGGISGPDSSDGTGDPS